MRTTRCLSCGLEYDADIEMCPRRYMTPHTEEFNREVSRHLGYKKPTSRRAHAEAIRRAELEFRAESTRWMFDGEGEFLG